MTNPVYQPAEGVFVFQDSRNMVNAGAVITDDGLIIIDALLAVKDVSGMLQWLSKNSERQPSLFFVTHEHFDHLGGSSVLQCDMYSSQAAYEAIKAMAATPSTQASRPQVRVPNICSDEMEFSTGTDRIFFKAMGGHSPGSAVIHFATRGVLFVGDLVFNGRPPYVGSGDIDVWMDNLKQLQKWEADVIIPGHGPAGGKEILLEQYNYLDSLVSMVHTMSQTLAGEELVESVATELGYPEHWKKPLQVTIERILKK